MGNKTEHRGIKVDSNVLSFLKKAENKAGSIRKLAKEIGISHVSIARWLGNVPDHQNDCIDWPSWEKVWRYLIKEGIISADDFRWMPPTVMRNGLISGRLKPAPGSDVDFVVPKAMRFPVVSLAAAAEINTTYYPLAEYADQNAEETVTFAAGRPGDFVIRVSGESMMPTYPPGTMLLVRPHQHIKSGDRVIAVLENGDAVFKYFIEREKSIVLAPANGNGRAYRFKKTDYSAIRDIYKVIQSQTTRNEADGSEVLKSGVLDKYMKEEEDTE